MKIVLTGGESGGHFYPLIAVAEELNRIKDEQHLLGMVIHFVAPNPYDERVLFEQQIIFHHIPAGKMRRYFSILNFFDFFKTLWGVCRAVFLLYRIFPDIVFSKGGYGSFPVVLAARILRIPVFIHESDSVPGRVNAWAGKFAHRVAVSWEEAKKFFVPEKTAFTGNPVRRDMRITQKSGAYEFLKLEEGVPTVLIMGGSQGAQIINDAILDALPRLVEKCQIIHQTGDNNYKAVSQTAQVILEKSKYPNRYRALPYLNKLALRMSAGVANLIVSRAGSAIFEIALWGIPSIIIPITSSNGDHQRKNAFSYAKAGAAIVIEEVNLTPNVLISEIATLLDDPQELERMGKNAKAFSKPDAAETIAKEIVKIAEKHEI